MLISGKARLALAAMLSLAEQADWQPGPAIARQLAVSKVYLEQILAPLKRARLIASKRGSKGGYRLAAPAAKITVTDILRVVEPRLFASQRPATQKAIYQVIDERVIRQLQNNINIFSSQITLQDLADDCRHLQNKAAAMFYI